jgi:hypothetical protein
MDSSTSPRLASANPIGTTIEAAAPASSTVATRPARSEARHHCHNHGRHNTSGATATRPVGEAVTVTAATAVAAASTPTERRRRANSASTSTSDVPSTISGSGRSVIP